MDKITPNKHGWATMSLARTIMALDPGDRLPTIIELTERLCVSRGIVQNAIAFLADEGCIALRHGGKLGTVLTDIDYAALFPFTSWDPIVGAMPVPFNDCFRSLASALFSESRSLPAESTVIYVSGARNRQALLKKNFLDYIVTSVAAADYLVNSDTELELLFKLPDCRYEEPYCLLFIDDRDTEIRDGMRVGVDPETVDQMELTKALCAGKDVELIPMPFETTVEMLHEHSIDCSVIRREKWLERNLGLTPRPIPETAYPAQDTTVPAVLINRNNYGIREFLTRRLSPERISAYQRRAMEIHSGYIFK